VAFPLIGIENSNEFYSQHYLDEVLEQDLKDLFARWLEQGSTSPPARLRAMAGDYLRLREKVLKSRTLSDRIAALTDIAEPLLLALGYELRPQTHEFESEALPILTCYRGADQNLALVIALAPMGTAVAESEWTALTAAPLKPSEVAGAEPVLMPDMDWETAASKIVFADTHPPRWLLLIGHDEFLVIERAKWGRKALLRFNLPEIFSRRDDKLFRAVAALSSRESILPTEGIALVDTLDSNSHKHAYGVSGELKHALRAAIEDIANEAIRYKREVSKDKVFDRTDIDLARELSNECLTFMYRMLFLLYLEARPELGYAPVDAEAYLKGYSVEHLRELENVPLTTPEALDGTYIQESLQKLFTMIWTGFPAVAAGQGTRELGLRVGLRNGFELAPLQGHLFDPSRLRILNSVKLRNRVMQKVIKRMSLADGAGRRGAGRISYAQLGINQLGAVYEALLSFRGFFAEEDLYEVKPAKKKASTRGEEAEDDADVLDEEGDDEQEERSPRRKTREEADDGLEPAWFVPARDIHQYTDAEKLFNGEPRKHSKGRFIYRLAGREREKSASYYTPEVLTRCLVKYALKELLKDVTSADDILKITVCEPAMGSAAFLNEAINQLAEEYLLRKQHELGQTIAHDKYAEERQRVKMFIADTNVFGVDLNPTAVQLAEVSLWLNAIFKGAHVPWFGMQLYTGNSLVGCRRDVFSIAQLSRGKGDKDKPERDWRSAVPDRVSMKASPSAEQVWHFLLPDRGMAGCNDKVVKSLEPVHFERMKKWRAKFNEPLMKDEVSRVQKLSAQVERLWQQHVTELARVRKLTTDELHVWPDSASNRAPTTTKEKDSIWEREMLSEKVKNASPYRRLKLAMDYWCALWFWPVTESDALPDRDEWWFDLDVLIHGNATPASALADDLFPETQPQARIDFGVERDRYGHVNLDVLLETNPRLKLANELAQRQEFFHWELEFADVFHERGGFDLILGNPPWIKVEWNEHALLSDLDARFAVRSMSAAEVAQKRTEALELPINKREYILECVAIEGKQTFLNAMQNYPELKGLQSNLYKCFLTQGWRVGSINGVVALVHEDGVFVEAHGGRLRRSAYFRLAARCQFFNEWPLFDSKSVAHDKSFGLYVYYVTPRDSVRFWTISNLFHPSTIDASWNAMTDHVIEGVKDAKGRWSTAGSRGRVLEIGREELEAFRRMYAPDSQDATEAPLPTLHVKDFVEAIASISTETTQLRTLTDVDATAFWHQTNAEKRDHLIRAAVMHPAIPNELIYTGAMIFVGNAFYKTPRRMIYNNASFDPVSLEVIGDDYLPRTGFVPAVPLVEYAQRSPVPEFDPASKFLDYYLLAFRNMLKHMRERTLIAAILPKGAAHINGIQSVAFKDPERLLTSAAVAFSVVGDFLMKAAGKSNLLSQWKQLPLLAQGRMRTLWASTRVLCLASLTTHFLELWRECWREERSSDSWASPDIRLRSDQFSALGATWNRQSAFRKDIERYHALVEIDVLVAQSFGLTLAQLLSIYFIQFPIMRQYECDTWYDAEGRIVFTSNRGQADVAMPRTQSRGDRECTIEHPDGRTERKCVGWVDVCDLPSGSRIRRTVTDDTMPGGPIERTIEYIAPFTTADREHDYRVAWAEFERRAKAEGKH
jgi:hypothetical protein